MAATWSDALRRVAEALGRRRRIAEGEEEATGEQGFTLIELMVVLLIMGILMAIAIPTFLGVTSGANDKSTQSNLTNLMTSAKAQYAQSGSYAANTKLVGKTGILHGALPNFTYVTTFSGNQNSISVDSVTTGNVLYASAYMTKTKACWFAKDVESTSATNPNIGVFYGVSKVVTKTATCLASKVATVIAWTAKWPTAPAGH